jgi:biopolymer transport protein ExbD
MAEQGPETEDQPEAERKRRAPREPASMQLNLTSMIDVIFQLLIYFVITASFAVEEGAIAAKLPKGSGEGDPTEPPKTKLKIRLQSTANAGARVSVDNRRVKNFAQLHERLVQLQDNPEKGRSGPYGVDNPVVIEPQGEVRWQHVVNAFNAAVRAEYGNVNFAAASD